ncbi:MAG: hypothetical protein Q8K64_09540 [Sediminibacterium sp.]|nr:hypothetical protein [Sediminibacterium sp.]
MRLKWYHIDRILFSTLIIIIIHIPLSIHAQLEKTDSVFFLAKKPGLLGKIGKSVSVNSPVVSLPQEGFLKNAENFEPFRGKIIRRINIRKIGFNKSVNDTSFESKNIFNDLGNALHTSTRSKVILNNLFFSKGDSLYPNLLADNEKLLRDLSFLQDAKLQVEKINGIKDSVDIVVYAKDVFPIGGSVGELTPDLVKLEMNDDNLFGSGNRIQIQHLIEAKRTPSYGIGIEFLKRNIAGSFINVALGYQNQNPAFNSGRREEKSMYIRADLPLVSPYHSITGGVEISSNKTQNLFIDDSTYQQNFQYNYRIFDGWMGFNIGAKKQLKYNFTSRLKKIISFRGVSRDFLSVPKIQAISYDSRYTDLSAALSSFTIFEQDFYHTNFVFGFGRNEDLPEGFNLSFTGGWTKRNNVERIYIGAEYERSYFNRRGSYMNYIVKLGSYYNQGKFEDISFLASAQSFTRLRKLGNSRWYNRNFLGGSLTQQFNTFLNDPVRLSSIYGVPLLRNPDTKSSGRFTLNAETVFYNTWKFFGFSFAPFGFTNISFLKELGNFSFDGDFYGTIGAGVRTRNENLVFGTMEMKAYYFPKTVNNMSPWNLTFSTELKYRYTTTLIHRPDVVQVN